MDEIHPERGQSRLSTPSRRRAFQVKAQKGHGVEVAQAVPSAQPAPMAQPAHGAHGAQATHATPVKRHVPTRTKRRAGWVYILFALFVVYFGTIIAGVLVFGFSARSALARVEVARERAEVLDFAGSRVEIQDARADLIVAEQGLFALNLLKPIPYVGNQIRAIDSVTTITKEGLDVVAYALNIGEDILRAADDLKPLLEAQEQFSFYDLPPETRGRILNAFAVSSSNLQTMRVRTNLAIAELEKIHTYNVAPPILGLIRPIEEVLPQMQRSIEFLIPVTSLVRELAGVGGDRQWLLLYLNNNELRPAGGFIGVYGHVLVREGELIELVAEDVLLADLLVQDNPAYQVAPPRPITDYMGVSNWYFRDSNWSPDFKTSADTAVQLLRQQHAFAGQPVPEFHGVIGLTPTVAERLLEYLGPIQLDGITFTHENVRDILQIETQYGYEERGLEVAQRKDLIAKLTSSVVDRLTALPISSIPDVIDILVHSFEDKQMALRSYAPDTQASIEQAKWGSVVTAPKRGDTLLVVDANMAALKTNPHIDTNIKYTITPQAGRLRARVDITYIHKGAFTRLVSRYRTFTRIFVPEGSQLIRVDGSLRNDRLSNPNNEPGYVLTEDSLGMTSFGTFTSVEPGRTHTLSFEYFLPDSVYEDLQANRYSLQLFKQMGAKDNALTLDLGFGKNLKTAEPPEARRDRGNDRYEWQGEFSSDKTVEVRF